MNKDSLLKALLADEPKNKERYVFVIENSKLSEETGFFKLEVLQNNKTVFAFKIQVDTAAQNPSLWAKIKQGESEISVGFVEFDSKSIIQKIKEGISTKLESGEIPFFPK